MNTLNTNITKNEKVGILSFVLKRSNPVYMITEVRLLLFRSRSGAVIFILIMTLRLGPQRVYIYIVYLHLEFENTYLYS